MKKGGGIGKTSNYTDKSAFDFFMENSTCDYSFFVNSKYGLMSLRVLNPGIISPYISTELNTFGVYINTLIMKIVFISHRQKNIADKTTMNEEEFQKEVGAQEKIYHDTNITLQPGCPAIVYRRIEGEIMNILSKSCSRHIERPKKIGVIAMEFAQGYSMMNSLLYPQQLAGFFIVLHTAWITGYSHGDFHSGNILIKTDNLPNSYFDLSHMDPTSWIYKNFASMRPMLIDFGLSKKLSTNQQASLGDYITQGKYTKAASVLARAGRGDDGDAAEPVGNTIFSFPRFYGWFTGDKAMAHDPTRPSLKKTEKKYPGDLNFIMNQLFHSRQSAINIQKDATIKLQNVLKKYKTRRNKRT